MAGSRYEYVRLFEAPDGESPTPLPPRNSLGCMLALSFPAFPRVAKF